MIIQKRTISQDPEPRAHKVLPNHEIKNLKWIRVLIGNGQSVTQLLLYTYAGKVCQSLAYKMYFYNEWFVFGYRFPFFRNTVPISFDLHFFIFFIIISLGRRLEDFKHLKLVEIADSWLLFQQKKKKNNCLFLLILFTYRHFHLQCIRGIPTHFQVFSVFYIWI